MSTDQISALIEQGEEQGCVNLSAFNELVGSLELPEEDVERLLHELDERGIDLADDCGRATDDTVVVNGDLITATTDSLQQFLNEAGRYSLLTAAEEVELAKKIE